MIDLNPHCNRCEHFCKERYSKCGNRESPKYNLYLNGYDVCTKFKKCENKLQEFLALSVEPENPSMRGVKRR